MLRGKCSILRQVYNIINYKKTNWDNDMICFYFYLQIINKYSASNMGTGWLCCEIHSLLFNLETNMEVSVYFSGWCFM